MNLTLKNDKLTVVVSTLGAEVQSMTTCDGVQLMWTADKAIWGRHAPLLFPIIGRLKDQQYTLDGTVIKIAQHGFARDTEFTVESRTDTAVTLSMTDSDKTRPLYPFSFKLAITYTLVGASLKKTHTVTNLSDAVLPYEIGGHDGYLTTIFEGEKMADYAIEFPNQDVIYPFGMDENCFLTPEKLTYPLTDHKLPLPPKVFGLDTVVLEKLPVNQVTLCSCKNGVRLTVDFPDFDYLGIWTKPVDFDTNYICIEPWTTLPECTFVGTDLKDKQGIRLLQPNGTESLSYTVSVAW